MSEMTTKVIYCDGQEHFRTDSRLPAGLAEQAEQWAKEGRHVRVAVQRPDGLWDEILLGPGTDLRAMLGEWKPK